MLTQRNKVKQNLPPQICLWYIGYFELKLFKKQLVQESHSDLPLSSSKLKINVPCGRQFPCTRRVEILTTRESGSLVPRRLYTQTMLLLHQFTIQLSCQFFTSLLFPCLKGTKAACFGHSFESHILYGAPRHMKLKFSPVNLYYVNYWVSQRMWKGKREKFSAPTGIRLIFFWENIDNIKYKLIII